MRDRGSDGFTVVRCGGCAAFPSGFEKGAAELQGVDEVLVEGLRSVVRDSRHGILVTARCPFGERLCVDREIGVMLLVQTCDLRRDRRHRCCRSDRSAARRTCRR